jgi:YesN/AraC family two-component response regulator
MTDAFLGRIWKTDSFAVVELNETYSPFMLPSDAAPRNESFDDVEATVKMMEMRYSFENELIRAVSQGQQPKGALFAAQLNEQMLERRVADPLRNAKNYCIIMNTLLRKAAEEGGVHPVYIDKTSSKFAVKIELLSSTKACTDMMAEMFSSYCRLVYKHSIKSYSPIVQKTILIIDSDISAGLSLGVLAQKQGISSGYLATIFKKETQKTVTEYIADKRMEYARYLLSTTQLQIQTVALHCGIVDVQHFSKVFKKKTGKAPREYREATRH